MTVKIDKYEMNFVEDMYDGRYCIVDKSTRHHERIIEIDTGNINLDKILCKMIFDELNTGKYEEDD